MAKTTKKKLVQVNLGCGTNLPEGFINVDIHRPSNADTSFIEGSVLSIPLDTESVDYVICDQVLEHLAMADVVPALYEMRRVLKKGGRAVIIVPDFEDAVRQWLSINHNSFFNPMVYHYLSEVIYGNQQHEGEFHKTAMCAGFLNYALGVAGFVQKELVFYPANGAVPQYPGVRYSPPEAVCRNAQLIADIIK